MYGRFVVVVVNKGDIKVVVENFDEFYLLGVGV